MSGMAFLSVFWLYVPGGTANPESWLYKKRGDHGTVLPQHFTFHIAIELRQAGGASCKMMHPWR